MFYASGFSSTGHFQHANGTYGTYIPMVRGQSLDIGLEERNDSRSGSLTLHPVTFPLGLPDHISLVREVAVRWSDVMISNRWPPNGDLGIAHRMKPVEGYRVPPRRVFVIVLEFRTDRPGTYKFKSITLHAGHSGWMGWLPIGSTATSYVDTGTFIFCVGAHKRPRCNYGSKRITQSRLR